MRDDVADTSRVNKVRTLTQQIHLIADTLEIDPETEWDSRKIIEYTSELISTVNPANVVSGQRYVSWNSLPFLEATVELAIQAYVPNLGGGFTQSFKRGTFEYACDTVLFSINWTVEAAKFVNQMPDKTTRYDSMLELLAKLGNSLGSEENPLSFQFGAEFERIREILAGETRLPTYNEFIRIPTEREKTTHVMNLLHDLEKFIVKPTLDKVAKIKSKTRVDLDKK